MAVRKDTLEYENRMVVVSERDVSEIEVDRYKSLVNKSLKKNNKNTLLGNTVEHKFVLLSRLFHETWKQALIRPTIVRMLISNRIDVINNSSYKEYLSYLDKALREKVRINILLLDMDTNTVEENLSILENYSHPNKNSMHVRVLSNRPEDIVFYKGKSLHENNINFELFGDKSYRMELLNEGKISICNFNNEQKTQSLAKVFDSAFDIAAPKLI